MADLPPGTLLAPATRSRLRDVAARAGVSATTASRVLNGNPTGLPVSEETVQRVREAAAELQYHPNAAARALGTRQTETIALIVPVVEDDEHNSHRHSHLKLSEVLSGICGVTRPHNYRLLIQMADRHFLETRAYLGLARSATVDGFIWWGAPVPSELLALHYPVVALNASADGVPHHRVLHDPAPESDSRRGRRLGVRDAAGESDDPRDLRVSRALRDGRRPGAILPPPRRKRSTAQSAGRRTERVFHCWVVGKRRRSLTRLQEAESAGEVRRVANMARMQDNRFSRRSFLGQSIGVAAALGAAAGLVACSPSAAPPATSASGTAAPAQAAQTNGTAKTLNLVWSGWILDQNPVINTLIANYAKETGVKITTSSAPDDLQQKVLLETNQKKSTWGGWEGHTAFLNTAPLVAANAISPFDPYLTEADKKDLLPTSIAEVTYKGQMYEFPFRVSPMAMIYRPSILDKLGYQQPPDTWEGIYELCEKAKANLSTSGKPFYGIVIWSTAWYGLWEVMETLVAEPFDTNAGLANMDLPEATQAMDIMKKLYSYAPTDTLSTDPTNYFQSGNVAMMMIYVLQAQRVKKALNGDVRIGRVPKTAKAQGTIFWSSGANLFANYGNLDEVAKFWLWLSNQKELYDTLWVKNGSPPNRISMLQKFNDLKGKELDAGFWDASDMQAHSQGVPNSLWIPIQAKYTKSETENYLLGKTASVEQAIQAIKKQTADEIAKQKQ